MKKQTMTAGLLLCLCIMSGCGNKEAAAVNGQETAALNEQEAAATDGQETAADETGEAVVIKENADREDGAGKNENDAVKEEEGWELSDSGEVLEITEDYFTLSRSYTKETDDGLLEVSSAISADGGETEGKVYYTDKTIFKILEVKNSGVDPERDVKEKEASIKNLKQGASVMLEGAWDGNECQADVVYIYHFM